MGAKEVQAFVSLRRCLLDACLQCIDENEPFAVECDAYEYVRNRRRVKLGWSSSCFYVSNVITK